MRGPGFGVFALSHVSWLYLRLVCLPLLIWRKNESVAMNLRPNFDFLSSYLRWNDIFLTCLLALNYYWYFLMCRIAYRAIFKGEVKDSQNDVTAGLAKDNIAKED